METNNAALQVRGLRKSYDQLHVLTGVDFDVARGSIFALLGSNGAGKTTIVRILTTLLKPDSGTASVDGFDVVSQPARVRESVSQADGQHARAAAGIQKPAVPIQARLLRQDGLELR